MKVKEDCGSLVLSNCLITGNVPVLENSVLTSGTLDGSVFKAGKCSSVYFNAVRYN